MNNKKLFLMLLMLIFVTGCGNISYDLDIRRNNIYENLQIQFSNADQNMELNSIVDSNIKAYSPSKIKNVSYEVDSDDITISNNFNTIQDLSSNEIINRLYDKVDIEIKDNITTVTFNEYNKASFECGEFDEGCLLVLDKVTVNLTSEYEITNSNADLIDKENNKYTWVLDANSDNIYFSYNDNILWNIVIKNFLKDNSQEIILVAIGAIILLMIIIIATKFLKAMKENNS